MSSKDYDYLEIDWKSCKSATSLEERLKLEEWAKELHEKVGNFLSFEIGTFCAGTSALLAQFGTVITVDPYGLKESYGMIGNYAEMFRNIERLKLVDRVFPVIGTSEFLCYIEDSIDVGIVFVDGAHDYESVYSDILHTADSVLQYGMMVFHDYVTPEATQWPGVNKAVNEWLEMWPGKIVEHYRGLLRVERDTGELE